MNSISSCVTLWNDGCGGATLGTAISSVSSNTSASGWGGQFARRSPSSIATTARRCRLVVGRCRCRRRRGRMRRCVPGGRRNLRRRNVRHRRRPGGRRRRLFRFRRFRELPRDLGLFRAAMASSSAMMRLIDARISSMEGSWTFAGCVISDSRHQRPRGVVLHQGRTGFGVSSGTGRDFHRDSLPVPKIKAALGPIHAPARPPLAASKRRKPKNCRTRRESSQYLPERLCHGNKRLQARHRGDSEVPAAR